jgi:ATP-dependent Clp protease ATP-binding subunit ClpA
MQENNLEFTEAASRTLNGVSEYGWGEEITIFRTFLSLIDNVESIAIDLLVNWGMPLLEIREMVFYECEKNPLGEGDKVIDLSKDFVNIDCIGVYDLLIFIFKKCPFIISLMDKYGFDYETLIIYLEDSGEYEYIEDEMGQEALEHQEEKNNLNNFCTDLVQKCREGKIDPVYGRDAEIRQTIKILCRKKKSNPVLVGDAGTGKSTIIYGLAAKIAEKDVPDFLLDCKIFELDLFGMLAGTKWRGDFEGRVKVILSELVGSNKKSIIFIDELHTIVGAGANSDDSGDLSNMLKPHLANGEIICIGATTVNEYTKFIEKDPALNRRFQKVMVKEPTEKECLQILKSINDSYCDHHGVKISALVLKYIVEKSSYIKGRSFPDKAIDLLDESCGEAVLGSSRKVKISEKNQKKIDEFNGLIMSAIYGDRYGEREYFEAEKDVFLEEIKCDSSIRVNKKHVDKALGEAMKSEGIRGGIGFGR